MTDETIFCTKCGEGTLEFEDIKESPNGGYIKTRYYSCGHKHGNKHDEIYISAKIGIKAGLKMESADKKGKEIKKEPRHEIVDVYDETYSKSCYKHFIKYEFQIVKYESGKFKHVDCKNCNQVWRHESGLPIKSSFLFEYDSEAKYLNRFKIQCPKCGAKYEASSESVDGTSNRNKKEPGQHIEYRRQETDYDNPGKAVFQIYCRNFVKYEFQVTRNELDESEQVICKTCGNEWQYNSVSPIESHFAFEHDPDAGYLGSLKIECLNCNAKYERYNKNYN
ncbi:hypothetical protein [Methanosarcina sp. UBA289]|uniref:hypothetical protein n=1 Tax=Methanosarcina sp. UBA289 TaxID=1915574 RepID=UPI0025D38F0A|nr:hypothetical protein [Methanosarcina sp. UBA289]